MAGYRKLSGDEDDRGMLIPRRTTVSVSLSPSRTDPALVPQPPSGISSNLPKVGEARKREFVLPFHRLRRRRGDGSGDSGARACCGDLVIVHVDAGGRSDRKAARSDTRLGATLRAFLVRPEEWLVGATPLRCTRTVSSLPTSRFGGLSEWQSGRGRSRANVRTNSSARLARDHGLAARPRPSAAARGGQVNSVSQPPLMGSPRAWWHPVPCLGWLAVYRGSTLSSTRCGSRRRRKGPGTCQGAKAT